MRVWTKKEIESLTWLTLEGVGADEIAGRLHITRSTVLDMQRELGFRGPKRQRWTEQEIALVREKYFETQTAIIAQQIGRPERAVWQMARKLGLSKSPALIASMARERSSREDHGGRRFQFQRGIVPHNKGLRRPGYAPGRMAETQFKKGQSINKMPLGAMRLIDGYVYRKISETPNVSWTQNWKLDHYLIWERVHGPVPAHHALVFRDRDRTNVQLENLELVTRAELAARNTIHNLPPDLKEVIRLNASIKRRVRKIHAEKQNERPQKPPVRDVGSAEGYGEAYGG